MTIGYTDKSSLDGLALLFMPPQYLIEFLLPSRLTDEGEKNRTALNVSRQAAILLRELPEAQRRSILTSGLSHENPVIRESCREMLDQERIKSIAKSARASAGADSPITPLVPIGDRPKQASDYCKLRNLSSKMTHYCRR